LYLYWLKINDEASGINLRSRVSGARFFPSARMAGPPPRNWPQKLDGFHSLEDLNHGFGVHSNNGTDFIMRRKDGSQLNIDVSGATHDWRRNRLDQQRSGECRSGPPHHVTAQLTQFGNGIELSTSDLSTGQAFAVVKYNGSQAAEDLGLVPVGATSSDPAVLPGNRPDCRPRYQSDGGGGVFNGLSRLHDALINNDLLGIQRAIDLLDDSSINLNLARGDLGARQQGLDVLQSRLDDEVISLKDALVPKISTRTWRRQSPTSPPGKPPTRRRCKPRRPSRN
jgi:flagellin-like hook-associated protein FlgL